MTRPTPPQREAARQHPPHRRTVLQQRWENLLFLHWTIDRETIQKSLPAGLYPDTFAGTAWLGIVPFAMRSVRPRGLPAVGRLSNFLELNVRTYVHDENGIPGVWFYSLDCNQWLAVWLARKFFGLPYERATMTADFDTTIDYHSTRRGTDEAAQYRWRPEGATRAATPGSLDFFLLERYLLYAARGRQLFRGQVAHTPYQFQAAPVEKFSLLPAVQAGFSSLSPQPQHTCHSPGVDVRIFGLEKLP